MTPADRRKLAALLRPSFPDADDQWHTDATFPLEYLPLGNRYELFVCTDRSAGIDHTDRSRMSIALPERRYVGRRWRERLAADVAARLRGER